MKKIFLFAFLLLFFEGTIIAQVTTSNIRGKIFDDQNISLMGADVIWPTLYFLKM
ncbi:hypothetical protein ATE84_3208 [Aquimarina sp. MAR_2010_214]|uniref:hypothetical protein n=1 Tax=Aquimarina sp. MAR_2010_214 TaxID=1250026 RepID=UPI000CBDEEC0|nr:hypothetical protein [Aquimarina sp. MAR_2010_214]PKV51138.1 hypothetical protein ATE84_3208 [Aquimarina sp. MAR_2010_214]